MSDGTRRDPAVSLERPGRLRPSWWRRLVRLAVVVGLCAVIIGRKSDVSPSDLERACAAAYKKSPAKAVQRCQLAFERTEDPATGAHLAGALNASGDAAAAKRIATTLLLTSARADAHHLLGQIAYDAGRLDQAVGWLEAARTLHRTESKFKELARDDGVLAVVRTDRSELAEALRLIEECIAEAQRLGDRHVEYYCHLVAVRTLVRVGYFEAAEDEIELAELLATSEDQRIDLAYQRGNIEQEQGHHALASVKFEEVLRWRRKPSASISRIIKTELNLAYSLAEQERIDDAQQHLENATLLASDNQKERERMWVAAQIAYRRNDLALASSLAARYFALLGGDDAVDRDDQIDVATLQARIDLQRGDLERTELWARRAVEQVEGVRREQSALELRPWVLTKRRAPYELRFTALARSHQVEAAAMVFNEWQGRTVQDALARPAPPAALDRPGIAEQVARLAEWLHEVSQSPFTRSSDESAVLSTMRGIDLLALIVADGDVWRLTANHGPPRLSRLAPLAEIKGRIEWFRDHPTEVEPAAALGALLLPDDSFVATRDVLHVIVDGQLGALPVAALRHGATPLIKMRPIVRVLRLPETPCVHVTRSGHATVLAVPSRDPADPRRKLPGARIEGERVAELLHTTSKTGVAATRAALFAAANDAVLHIAAHSKLGGAAIPLADGEVSALEISAHRLAPSLTVLSVCSAATSKDAELAGSLAAGFLAAGSQHVVATLGSVSDPGALEVSTRFYAEGGVADPARALAAVQSALANKPDNTDWPFFTVFGPDVCLEGAPEHR